MKKFMAIFAIIMITEVSSSFAQKPGFFVKCVKAEGDTVSKYVKNIERLFGRDISEAFHCATVNSNTGLQARLRWEKEYQVSGGTDELSLCAFLKADYLVLLSMIEGNENLLQVSAKCIDLRKKTNIAEAIVDFTTDINYAGVGAACKQISNSLIKELGKYEICAFTGSVSITINSVKDSTNTIDYGVYCNEMDQRFHQEIKQNNHTTSDWKLERKDIFRTEGTMTFNSNELSKVTEENGCYKCKSGREGGRTYTEIRSMRVNGSGISHESSYKGKPQDDTRIELKFLENGTYLLIAKGTSQPAKSDVKLITSAVGTCDNIPQNTKLEQREISIPLKVIFGPYAGKTTDKLLQQKDTKEVKDPVTKEKQTIAIDFSLTQKDK